MKDEILHKRKRLAQTARDDIIGESGMQWLSACEIAGRQNFSQTAMFRHFVVINALQIAVSEHSFRSNRDIYQLAPFRKRPPRNSIRYFISARIDYYVNYPDITSVIQLNVILYYALMPEEKIKSMVSGRENAIVQLVKAA